MKRSFRATIFLKQLNDSNKKNFLEMSIQPKPKSTERAIRVQLAVLFSIFGVNNFKIAASSTVFVGYSFCFSCRYSSKILLNSFVALFVLCYLSLRATSKFLHRLTMEHFVYSSKIFSFGGISSKLPTPLGLGFDSVQ
jgi:hypothetical protein